MIRRFPPFRFTVVCVLPFAIASCTPSKPAVTSSGPPSRTEPRNGWGPTVTIDRLNRELEELRALQELGDDDASAARFQPLMFRFLARTEVNDLRRMLRDPSPLVRAMALFCLAYQPSAIAAGSDPKLLLAIRAAAGDGSALPNDLVALHPPLINESGPITVAQIAEFVQSAGARDRMPALPMTMPATSTASDCARLLRFCRSAVDASAELNDDRSSTTQVVATRESDSAAWIGLTIALTNRPQRNVLDQMLRDASPIVRAAGLVAIARSNQPDAVDILSLALGDDGRIWPTPQSTSNDLAGEPMTSSVGDLAARMLTDAKFLSRLPGEAGVDSKPHRLLEDDARRALILRMLAADGPISRQATVRAAFATDLREATNPVDALLAFVGQRDVTTLKALGRGAFDNTLNENAVGAVRTFLISCVDDATLDAPARFAAASALTRDGTGSAISALAGAANELDALSPDTRLGQRFVTEARLRAQLAASEATPSSATAPAAIELAGHPLLLSILRTRDGIDWRRMNPFARPRSRRSIKSLSGSTRSLRPGTLIPIQDSSLKRF